MAVKLKETGLILMGNLTFFLAVTFIVWLPAYAIIILKNTYYTGIDWPLIAGFYGPLLPGIDFNKLLSDLVSMSIDAAIISLMIPLYGGVVIYGAYMLQLGKGVSVGQALMEGLKKWWTMLCISFFYSLLVFFGCLLFLVPGIILAAIFSLVFVNAMVEKGGIWHHFERSLLLAKPQLKTILGASLTIFFVWGMISAGIQGMIYWWGLDRNQMVLISTGVLGQLISLIYWVFPLPFYNEAVACEVDTQT